ncbi:hypothetical protein MVEN_00449800 [Mycena venus]|uniref:Uncharacterized protein n=1 Tax=Mycena venus TaxID=2733690 RepID=A0A8H6YR96_9AGAR|nr:hypothetical protein MVEN_00449800 [Mycena venus]
MGDATQFFTRALLVSVSIATLVIPTTLGGVPFSLAGFAADSETRTDTTAVLTGGKDVFKKIGVVRASMATIQQKTRDPSAQAAANKMVTFLEKGILPSTHVLGGRGPTDLLSRCLGGDPSVLPSLTHLSGLFSGDPDALLTRLLSGTLGNLVGGLLGGLILGLASLLCDLLDSLVVLRNGCGAGFDPLIADLLAAVGRLVHSLLVLLSATESCSCSHDAGVLAELQALLDELLWDLKL